MSITSLSAVPRFILAAGFVGLIKAVRFRQEQKQGLQLLTRLPVAEIVEEYCGTGLVDRGGAENRCWEMLGD
jgi:hypothetical protein